ncbi:MAG: hypothetical protein ACREM1_16450 [Longimicrobiales bacterium]
MKEQPKKAVPTFDHELVRAERARFWKAEREIAQLRERLAELQRQRRKWLGTELTDAENR